MTTRREIYRLLNHGCVWFRADGPPEEGHSMLYAPHRGILRCYTSELGPAAQATQTEFLSILRLGDKVPSVLGDGGDMVEETLRLLELHGSDTVLFFEGYAFNAELEGRDRYERVAQSARDAGYPVLLSNAAVADHWNNKQNFKAEVVKIHGPTAVPITCNWATTEDIASMVAFAEKRFHEGALKVIFKASGAGGFGNLLVVPTDDVHAKLTAFLEQRVDESRTWVTGEEWRPWHLSPCTSFFSDGTYPPVWMEMCDQVLSPETAGFIGGRSFFQLSTADRSALADHIRPVAQEMYEQGVRGFVGVDTILCDPREGDSFTLPDSGLAVLFIETNARLNGNNQERLFVSLLAERDGVPMETIDHMRIGNKPIAHAADRKQSMAFFAEQLSGFARPLTWEKLTPGEVYFTLDVNHGSSPSMYDAVMLVGIRATDAIDAAYTHLLQSGVLRT